MSFVTIDLELLEENFRSSPYHYVPSEKVGIMFIALFGLSTFLHYTQATYYRMWWLLPTIVLCGLLEIVGWVARLWSSFSPTLAAPFKMQIVATIIGPTPLLAANFVILGALIHRLGIQYSRLSPKIYTTFFLSCDMISLVVQGVGGALAAGESGSGQSAEKGGHIMLGGIVFQLFVIIVFTFCAGEFFIRYLWDLPIRAAEPSEDYDPESKNSLDRKAEMSLKIQLMVMALCFSILCLVIRAIYRTIELADGWNGRIISTQILFIVLDGAMITLAMYTMNLAHPGLLLGQVKHFKLPKTRSNGDSRSTIVAL